MTAVPNNRLLSRIAAGLSRRAGFHFNPNEPAALWHALQNRLQITGLANPESYLQHLREDETEWLRLAEAAAIHETSFFRHAGQFRVLSEIVMPELVRSRAQGRQLRLWSAACATGEEPYSLAIAVHQLNLGTDWQIRIVATDLSSRALAIAEEGVFPSRRLRPVAPDVRARCFEPHGEGLRVRDELRSLVTFFQFNLSQPGPLPEHLQDMDVVFCRNVLIYFVPEAVRQTVDHLRAALRDGGYLFLGDAETLYGMSAGFVSVPFEDAYVYRRQTTSALAPASSPQRTPAVRTGGAPEQPHTPPQAAKQQAPRPAVTSAELQRTVESYIAVDDLTRASQAAKRWMSLEPDSLLARFTLARLYAAQIRDAEAAQLLRELLARDSLHAPSYVLLGIICSRQGEMDEAIAQFQHAIYLEPRTPLAYFFLGNIYQELGQLRLAQRAYQQVLGLVADFVPEWDSGFTSELLVQVCKRNITRLEKVQEPAAG